MQLSSRDRWILAQLERLRRYHPELRRRSPIGWAALARVIERIGLELVVRPLPRRRLGMLLGFGGRWSVVVNQRLPARRHTYYAAHELGHYVLHVEASTGPYEHCYSMDQDWRADVREDEAELFATAVLAGPALAERWAAALDAHSGIVPRG